MAQTGKISFFSTREPGDPQAVLERVLRWGGIEQVNSVSRYEVQEFSWDDWQELLAASAVEPSQQEPSESGEWIEIVDDDSEEQLFQCTIAEAVDCYEPGKLLQVMTGYGRQAKRLYQAIESEIAESLRRDFAPDDLVVWVGRHDLFDTEESPQGTLFGRAHFSVGFFGFGSPNDWSATRQAIVALPEVQAIQRELEAIIGPLDVCVIWDT